MNKIATALLTALFAAGSLCTIASAQPYPGPYGYTAWQNGRGECQRYGQFRRQGDRDGDDRACGNRNGRSTVRGSIVGVMGNQIVLRTSSYRTITIDDQPALNNRTTGRVAVGRFVTAYGYWRGNEFFATRLV